MGISTGALLRVAIAATTLALPLAGCSTAPERTASTAAWEVDVPEVAHPSGETAQWWYRSGAAHAARNGAMAARAKNVIVFLGDGMSLSTVAAARILQGQRAGGPGEENLLSWERFPHSAFSKTYNTDSQTPDSAGTMTAVATGVKSHMGAIGVSAGSRYDCADSQGRHVLSWLRLADDAGLATGIVTTARITHATPAATYAHVPDRNWETDAAMPQAARAAGCSDIARQLLDFAPGHGPSVILGGGRGYLIPATARDPEYPDKAGLRQDGRDLTAEWLQRNPGGAYVWNNAQLRQAQGADRLLGLFEFDHMQYEHDRRKDDAGEPDLAEMTRVAISRLSRDGTGFVLLVEGGRIDHGNHEGNAFRALDETTSMARAVQVAAEMTSAEDTLIVVTADHSHTLNIVGYPKRGNPILGKVRGRTGEEGDPDQLALDALGLPYTTLVYASGAGNTGASNLQPAGPKRHPHTPTHFEPVHGRPDLGPVDTAHPDYMQEALLPMPAETHGGDDVGIWARGPGAEAFRSTMEQNVIYHVVVQAAPRLRERLCAAGYCNADGVPVDLPDPARFDKPSSSGRAAQPPPRR